MIRQQKSVHKDHSSQALEASSVAEVSNPELVNVKRKMVNGLVPWNPWVAIVYAAVIFFAAQIIAVTVIKIYGYVEGWSNVRVAYWFTDSTFAQFWYVLMAEAITFGAIWWFVKRRKSNLASLGLKRFKSFDIISALAGFAVYFIGYAIILAIVTHLIPALNVSQSQDIGFQDTKTDLELLAAFVSLVILPPIVEETLFRGFIFGGLKNKLPVVWSAIITSALFASAHLQFGSGQPLLWVAAIDTFTLSLVLCYLRQKTGRLWAGILLHSLKNLIAFTVLFLLHVR
ncbi:MAG: CPBP family intramembrane glutamic endopeptidase [Candidatus Saccharimonadales bacterium]